MCARNVTSGARQLILAAFLKGPFHLRSGTVMVFTFVILNIHCSLSFYVSFHVYIYCTTLNFSGFSLLNVVLLTADIILNFRIKMWKLAHLVESGADACIDEYFLHANGSCNNHKYYRAQKGIYIYWITHWFLYLYNIPKIQLNDINSSWCKSPSFRQVPTGFSYSFWLNGLKWKDQW